MPRFIIKFKVVNGRDEAIRTHVGASLVGAVDHVEYFNKADDIDWTFSPGTNIVQRYLTTELGAYQKYDLYVVLWELAKPIGQGTKYASAEVPYAVEKKKKIIANLSVAILDYTPRSF